MRRYDFSKFMENMDKIQTNIELKEKKEGIGMIISALQAPMKNVITGICVKQVEDLDELLNTIGWKR